MTRVQSPACYKYLSFISSHALKIDLECPSTAVKSQRGFAGDWINHKALDGEISKSNRFQGMYVFVWAHVFVCIHVYMCSRQVSDVLIPLPLLH